MFDVAELEEGVVEVMNLKDDEDEETGGGQQLDKQGGRVKLLQSNV